MKKSTITEKRLSVEEQIKALKNKKRQLEKQEKSEAEKARKARQKNRGELIEKLVPHLATLNDTEFEDFIRKTLLTETKTTTPPVKSQGGILTESEVAEDEE